jgi:hypothetical protein
MVRILSAGTDPVPDRVPGRCTLSITRQVIVAVSPRG